MHWLFFAQHAEPAAQTSSSILRMLISPAILPFVVAIVAIVVWGVVTFFRIVVDHRERITMIRQGMHPDDSQATPGKFKRPL